MPPVRVLDPERADWFRFVDTHLESFDSQPSNPTSQGTEVGNGEIRAAQAKQLIHKGGPASGGLPVILVGDLNSDVRTPLKPGDQLATRRCYTSIM